jgi:hypothetical protein
MTAYYETNPADPFAPVLLAEYNGIKAGDLVTYDNPQAPPLPGELRVSAFYQFGPIPPDDPGWTSAILNDGEYEVDAANLRRAGEEHGDG